MLIVDTHCHLYLEEFDADRDALVKAACDKGIGHIYLPAIDSETHQRVIDTEIQYPSVCHAMMGLHPCYVKENFREELSIVADWLSKRPFVAIGEAGLDFYWDKTFVREQYMALETQLEWAFQYNLPIILHTRNATCETIEVVKPYAQKGVKGIFHCFGGTREEAGQIANMGFSLGIGGVLTYKNSGLQEAIKDVPLDHIVLETDAPYLTPVPHRGRRNQPLYILHVLEKLAEVKGMDVADVAELTSANARKLFQP